MKRNEVMCVFYNKAVDDYKSYNKFMDILDEHRKILKPLYYENDDGKVLMVFFKRRLKNFTEIICDVQILKLLNDVLEDKHPYCSKCGCGYMTYHTYTYRDNCGCLGRSYECEVCKMYSDKAARKIRDCARKRGTKRILLKVLNNKFFKEKDFQNDEENNYDDLPF